MKEIFNSIEHLKVCLVGQVTYRDRLLFPVISGLNYNETTKLIEHIVKTYGQVRVRQNSETSVSISMGEQLDSPPLDYKLKSQLIHDLVENTLVLMKQPQTGRARISQDKPLHSLSDENSAMKSLGGYHDTHSA